MAKNVEMSQYDKTVYKTLVHTGTLLDALITTLVSKGVITFEELLKRSQEEIECINSVAYEADQVALGSAPTVSH